MLPIVHIFLFPIYFLLYRPLICSWQIYELTLSSQNAKHEVSNIFSFIKRLTVLSLSRNHYNMLLLAQILYFQHSSILYLYSSPYLRVVIFVSTTIQLPTSMSLIFHSLLLFEHNPFFNLNLALPFSHLMHSSLHVYTGMSIPSFPHFFLLPSPRLVPESQYPNVPPFRTHNKHLEYYLPPSLLSHLSSTWNEVTSHIAHTFFKPRAHPSTTRIAPSLSKVQHTLVSFNFFHTFIIRCSLTFFIIILSFSVLSVDKFTLHTLYRQYILRRRQPSVVAA